MGPLKVVSSMKYLVVIVCALVTGCPGYADDGVDASDDDLVTQAPYDPEPEEPRYCPPMQGVYQMVQTSPDCYGFEFQAIQVLGEAPDDAEASDTSGGEVVEQSGNYDTCADPIASLWSDDSCEYRATRQCYGRGRGSYLDSTKTLFSYDGSRTTVRATMGFDNGVVCHVNITITRIN